MQQNNLIFVLLFRVINLDISVDANIIAND